MTSFPEMLPLKPSSAINYHQNLVEHPVNRPSTPSIQIQTIKEREEEEEEGEEGDEKERKKKQNSSRRHR